MEYKKMNKMKYIELFGGIGALTQAIKNIGGGNYLELVDYVEIDENAVSSFNNMNNTNFEPQDVKLWDKDLQVDLIMHGSPCQDFSIAGKHMGGDEGSNTRSSLMYETIRIVKKLRPKYVIWENVKNIISKKHIHNFNKYLDRMSELGYTNYYQVINARDYGIPQNRERVFTISILGDEDFTFPPKQELKLKLKDMLEDEVDEYFFNVCPSMISALKSGKVKDITNSQYCQTITTKQARWNNAGLLKVGDRYRYLTTLETWRLMGFSDEAFHKAEQVNSIANLYKQSGNSIVVNILEEIMKEILRRE